MSERPPRKRLITKTLTFSTAIPDEMEYFKNKSSANVRMADTWGHDCDFKIYYDKHYLGRVQHGDERGKREGIETETVLPMVQIAIKHLFFYSSFLKTFSFINHCEIEKFVQPLRIVVKQGAINIVIEIHFLTFYEYEVTIITAINNEGYKPQDGQYMIELTGADNSILWLSQRGKVLNVCSI